MSGLTSYEERLLLARGLVELSEGVLSGPGLAWAKRMLALDASGVTRDPTLPPSPPEKQPVPLRVEPLTNDQLDGIAPVQDRPAVVLRGTNEWVDLQRQVEAEEAGRGR